MEDAFLHPRDFSAARVGAGVGDWRRPIQASRRCGWLLSPRFQERRESLSSRASRLLNSWNFSSPDILRRGHTTVAGVVVPSSLPGCSARS
ncbi:hypothetical protein BRADI_5g03156v3 [Brachypodium distachyon]|uniref:Uncharacterized protein n=1 Tax=Brachypodium distachyon TaxID=15368 RepID=A0A0Q3KPJ2_BRADI|nr:hypothetical protein BRADI_5g03156v3 [Brachypodium distachyon]